MTILPYHWPPFYEARVAILRRDFGTAEHLLTDVIVSQRWLVAMPPCGLMHSPLLTLLSHFYLGHICEATGRRDNALGEYRLFASLFEGSPTGTPQVAQARAAVKRLR